MLENGLVEREKPTKKQLSVYLTGEGVKKSIQNSLGPEKAQKFIASLISFTQNNPKLLECDNGTLVSAALLGESLNLSAPLSQYYIVPFKEKASFILSYKGMIQLAARSGNYKRINVLPIKSGELKKYDPMTEEIKVEIIEDEDERESAETIGYYAMFEYHNGFVKSLYWRKEKMMIHADKYSPAFSRDIYEKIKDGKIDKKDMWKYSSYWYANFDDMACKTMLRQLISKWGIMSVEMQEANEKSYESEIAFESGSQQQNDKEEIEDIFSNGEIIEKVEAEIVE